ncbi:C6 transcription factor [Penicillium atrosanguineum]|nr:C6 transcription factor [Penicillium atrosanguineum]KAJ5145307.1 C6 transcription factor [Penicillium atrosanguineum]
MRHGAKGDIGLPFKSKLVILYLLDQTPLLIDVTISRLRNILPNNSDYRLASAYHRQETSIEQSNMGKVFSACILLTFRIFMLEAFNSRNSLSSSPIIQPIETGF